MSALDVFGTDPSVIERDRFGRPLIKQADGKAVAYRRCTTYVGVLEDTYNLRGWAQRLTLAGYRADADARRAVDAAFDADDKGALRGAVEAAFIAGGGEAAANYGTDLHAITEADDRGEDPWDVPLLTDRRAELAADLDAYRRATAGCRWTVIEQMTVLDEHKVAGTPDRFGHLPGDDTLRVFDLKTGTVDGASLIKIAMQLAVYARSALYDHATGGRTPSGVDTSLGYVIHVPAGTGTARLIKVDLDRGWRDVGLAAQVWAARGARHKVEALEAVPAAVQGLLTPEPDPILALIARSTDRATMLAAHDPATWTDAHRAAAKARVAELGQAAA